MKSEDDIREFIKPLVRRIPLGCMVNYVRSPWANDDYNFKGLITIKTKKFEVEITREDIFVVRIK